MPGIFERLGALAGSDMEKAADAARHTFRDGLDHHGHYGRAVVETLGRLCRDHPNIVGVGVGVLIEQVLAEDKRQFERRQQLQAAAPVASVEPHEAQAQGMTEGEMADGEVHAASAPALPAPAARPHLDPRRIHPIRLALEVFGGLMLLKLGLGFGRLFRRRRLEPDSWLASAARIHTLSAAIATYCLASSIRSARVSAWRNAAIGLFGTDAIKPLVKRSRMIRAAA
jgi:hypothetical protein